MHTGEIVKFSWWTGYKAPTVVDPGEHPSWHTVEPGETGIIVKNNGDGTANVLFSKTYCLLRVHETMLEPIE